MTSKEALERIIFEAKMEKPIFSRYYQEYIKPIEKDLEILERIKHLMSNLLIVNNRPVKNTTRKQCYEVLENIQELLRANR